MNFWNDSIKNWIFPPSERHHPLLACFFAQDANDAAGSYNLSFHENPGPAPWAPKRNELSLVQFIEATTDVRYPEKPRWIFRNHLDAVPAVRRALARDNGNWRFISC